MIVAMDDFELKRHTHGRNPESKEDHKSCQLIIGVVVFLLVLVLEILTTRRVLEYEYDTGVSLRK